MTESADVEAVFRAEYGRAVAVLVRAFGDIGLAEEAVQEAFATALQRWPRDGLPPSPAGWIITTARNRAIDRLRREARRDDHHAQAVLLHAAREFVGRTLGDRYLCTDTAVLLTSELSPTRFSTATPAAPAGRSLSP